MTRSTRRGRFRLTLVTALALATSACAPVRTPAPPPAISANDDVPLAPEAAPQPAPAPDLSLTPGHRAAARAISLVGVPYRFGGSSPSVGFDCSGLIQHAYQSADMFLPRESREQRLATVSVRRGSLEVGDLLFYRRGRGQSLHVALYVGHNLFVHAPSRGGLVRVESMDTPHWKRRFIEARRPALPWDTTTIATR